jgi:hypothetical protein
MKVNLTYYRYGGKFSSEGSYETQREHLFEIHEEVQEMLEAGCLPGIRPGHSQYLVSVDVPEHPHNHPRLVMAERPRRVMLALEA